jgi:hypothetical protein
MIVGRAPTRSTSRAVASKDTSSQRYAAVGLKPGSGFAWMAGVARTKNRTHVTHRSALRIDLDMTRKSYP